MNWVQDGRTDRFRYVRVSWPDLSEKEQLANITAATITENSLTSLKASGKLSYVGDLSIGDDLIRIYSDSVLGDDAETVCHGTFFVTTPKSNWSGAVRSGEAEMYSVLWVLQQNKTTDVLSIEAQTNAVALAADLAKGYGNNLSVIASACDACVNAAHTWDAGTSYLEIVNWLLDFAGFVSAEVDAYGNVRMIPAVSLADKHPAVIFSDVQDSVSEPSFTHEFDSYEIPNKVTLICSNAENEPMVAHAANDDPESPYSTVSRNKLVVRVETVTDIADQSALNAKAQELLISGMSVVESIEIGHSYQPFQIGDAVLLDYVRAGYRRKLVTVSREKQMKPGIRCKTKARRFVNLALGE